VQHFHLFYLYRVHSRGRPFT